MNTPAVNLPGYPEFRKVVRELCGIDLDSYKSSQVERRLAIIMHRAGAKDLPTYAQLLAADPRARRRFLDLFLINVSEWLRNPEKWHEFQTDVLPYLLQRSPNLLIWSAGCSIGCEPYSLSLILDQVDPHGRHHIIASDLDEDALEFAKQGIYRENELHNVSADLRSIYFDRLPDERYAVKPVLRSRITFERRNLLADPAPGVFDLILCRNVVIYFTEESKDQLYQKLAHALKAGGILWAGATEAIMQSRGLGLSQYRPFFYRKVSEAEHDAGA